MKTDKTTQEKLNERLQPIYAEFLKENGIETGDIDPLTAELMDNAERELARVIDHWLGLVS